MKKTKKVNTVHIRFKQRTVRKGSTTVQGLEDPELSVKENKSLLKKLAKTFRKKLSCSCAVKEDDKFGLVLQLSGDQREKLKDLLIENHKYDEEDIKLHGF
jgi:translation initiation factor SUI1